MLNLVLTCWHIHACPNVDALRKSLHLKGLDFLMEQSLLLFHLFLMASFCNCNSEGSASKAQAYLHFSSRGPRRQNKHRSEVNKFQQVVWCEFKSENRENRYEN